MKQVIVVRKDLNMRKGKIAAQVAHASMKIILDSMSEMHGCKFYTRELKLNQTDPLAEWLQNSFAKIVVSVDSLEELETIEKIAICGGIRTAKITDHGRTEFHGVPTVTCIAIGPDIEKDIDIVTGDLPLL